MRIFAGLIPMIFLLAVPSGSFAAGQILCGGIAPEPSEWTSCTLEGSQSRVSYACNQDTGTYQTKIESQECDSGFIRLSFTQFGLAFLLLFAGAAGLAVWKKRINMRPDK